MISWGCGNTTRCVWMLLGVLLSPVASANSKQCKGFNSEQKCTSASGCADCPCIWKGEYNMGCRSCADSDCGTNDEDEAALHTLRIILIVIAIFVVAGCGVLGGWWYMRRRRAAKGGAMLHASTPPPSAPSGGTAATVGKHTKPAASPGASTEGPRSQPVILPPYWTTKSGVSVVQDPSMLQEVQKLMSETWKVKYTRDRKLAGGSGVVPSGCRVLNVLRVEHHQNFEKLWTYKQDVRQRRSGPAKVGPFPTATRGKLNRLDDDINEVYLFHGTSPQAADSIVKSDFRISKAGSSTGTMFGPGIYLAENASKSDEYAKEGEGIFVGQYAMLICRAVSGRVLTVTDAGDYSDKVRSTEYDCVCGDRLSTVGTFREMVFFREESVYAEYIAIYTREFE